MKSAFFATTALVAALMLGCKDEPKTTPPAPSPAPAPATEPATPATQPAVPATEPSSATTAIPGLPSSVEVPPIPSVPSVPSTPAPEVPAAAAGAADDMQAKAKSWLDEADKALKSGKFGDAQQIVEKLNGIKNSLSPEWQEKINQLSSAVDKAKNLKVPGLNN